MDVKVLVQILIIEFGLRAYSTRYNENNTKISIEVNNQLDDKVLNLATDPNEHFNVGLHITQIR